MDLPAELALFHQPARLRIMGMLYKHRDLSFVELRDRLGLSDGNLATHARRLEDAGHLVGRKVLQPTGFVMRYQITGHGSHAFRRYLAHLRGFLGEFSTDDEVRPPNPENSGPANDPAPG